SRKIALYGIIAALYVVLTVTVAPLAYGPLQFRVSELLVPLIMFDFGFTWPLLIGTAMANLFSPLGMVDVVFGTLGTAVGILSFMLAKKYIPTTKFWQEALQFVIAFGVIGMFVIAVELNIVYEIPTLIAWIEVMIGQIVVLIIGVGVVKKIYPRLQK
ncbi:MAG: QueT transporter family protein, partial [Culicoidibacterales bacterium]